MRKKESGFGLVEVMVAAVISVVVISAIFKSLSHFSVSGSSTLKLSDLPTLKTNIRNNVDCEKTLPPIPPATIPLPGTIPCIQGSLISLKRKDGNVISLKYGTPAIWEIRATASCPNPLATPPKVTSEILVEAHQIGTATGPGMNKHTLLRTDWFDLFNGASDLCRPYFSTGSPVCTAPAVLIGMAGGVPVCSTPPAPLIMVQKTEFQRTNVYPWTTITPPCPAGTVIRGCMASMTVCTDATICGFYGAHIDASNNTCIADWDPDDRSGSTILVTATCGPN